MFSANEKRKMKGETVPEKKGAKKKPSDRKGSLNLNRKNGFAVSKAKAKAKSKPTKKEPPPPPIVIEEEEEPLNEQAIPVAHEVVDAVQDGDVDIKGLLDEVDDQLEWFTPYDPENDPPIALEAFGHEYTVIFWKPGDEVVTDEVIAVDTETEEIIKGAPIKEVLIQAATSKNKIVQIAQYPHVNAYWQELKKANPDTEWIFHNAPFDLKVLKMTDAEHKEELIEMLTSQTSRGTPRITDTQIRFILHALAKGTYMGASALDVAVRSVLGRQVDKSSTVRLSFLQGMPISMDHLVYAAKDPIATMLLRKAMPKELPTEDIQIKGYMALTDISDRGLLVDFDYRSKLKEKFEQALEDLVNSLSIWGWYSGEGSNGRMQEILRVFEGEVDFEFPRTDKAKDPVTGKPLIQSGKALIARYEENKIPIPAFLQAKLDYEHKAKILSTYLDGDVGVDNRVHSRFSPLVKTGRTSSSDPNIQNIPREENIRGLYIPKEGHVLYASDYAQLELCALAETCYIRYGFSRMRDLINEGLDLHMTFGLKIKQKYIESESDSRVRQFRDTHLREPSAEELEAIQQEVEATCMTDKEYRQQAKACNFGYPGGLGTATFIEFAKGYGQHFTEDEARMLKEMWLEEWPEMEKHLNPTTDRRGEDGDETWYLGETTTGRKRAKCSYNEACNYPFQGLSADGAKEALWELYIQGFPTVNFIHDEVIVELPEDGNLQENCRKIDRILVDSMKKHIHHVELKVEGALMRRWAKEAEPIHDENGDLLIWTPELQESLDKKKKAVAHTT